MKFVFCAFVVLSFSEAFAAPQTALEGESSGGVSVSNTISSRDELFSEDSILQSDNAQGRKIKFLNKGAAYLTSSVESGESASIEDSDEHSGKKVTKTKSRSESSSTEDSDESAPLENNQENENNFKSIKGETSGGRPVIIIMGRPEGEPEAGETGKTAETADTTDTADTADTAEAAAMPKPGSPTNPTTAHSVTPKPTTASPQTKKPYPKTATESPQTKKPESKSTAAGLYTKQADPVPTTTKPLATEAASAKPVDEATNEPVEIAITPKPKPPKRPKPAKATSASPLAAEAATAAPASPATVATAPPSPPSTESPNRRYPCRCAGGLCSCCTGMLLDNLNVPIRSRACANITYEPDDFAFNFALSYNSRVLYNTRVSAKNPRPVCIPINRYFGVKMCAKISNVYMSGRNVHACLDLEGFLDDESAFKYSFNCFRIGASGLAVVRPEDGGGLPPPPDEEPQTNEDYDDSARGWSGEVQLAAV